jgi:NAD-dependent SIR2 family protein deacetylase
MDVKINMDEMSSCNECLDRAVWAQVIITVGGMSIKLCENCRKELMKKLVEEF